MSSTQQPETSAAHGHRLPCSFDFYVQRTPRSSVASVHMSLVSRFGNVSVPLSSTDTGAVGVLDVDKQETQKHRNTI